MSAYQHFLRFVSVRVVRELYLGASRFYAEPSFTTNPALPKYSAQSGSPQAMTPPESEMSVSALEDTQPRDIDRADAPHNPLLAMPGDVMRLLVPRGLMGKELWNWLDKLKLFWHGPNVTPFTLSNGVKHYYLPNSVGKLRIQDGAACSEIRLRVSGAPKAGEYCQFAIVYDEPGTGKEIPVLGTFRWTPRPNDTSEADFIEAVRAYFADYPYTPITVDVRGSSLRLRVYHSDRFRVGHVKLRTGLGTVLDSQTNTPGISVQKAGSYALPAQDVYSVSVLDDIEAGNVFSLYGKQYEATGFEQPQDILSALGVPDGVLTIGAGENPAAGVAAGYYNSPNTNTPSLEVLFDHSDGATDYYSLRVGSSLTAGNLFQVACDSQATKSMTATALDTPDSVAAFFKTSGGYYTCPAGKKPVALALSGVQRNAGSNNPGILCVPQAGLPARTVDRYTYSVRSSIKRGNVFVYGTKRAVAPKDTTTPAQIAALLGWSSQPMRLDVPAGQTPPVAYGEPGDKYNAEQHLAPVQVVAGSIWRQKGQLVCEFTVPRDAKPGLYQLSLAEQPNNSLDFADPLSDAGYLKSHAVSSYIRVLDNDRDTALLLYGQGDGGSEYINGYEYHEPGLMQRVRVPVALSKGVLIQQESWSKSLDGSVSRSSFSAERRRTLTTTPQPESFHRAMIAALKHPQVYLCLPPYYKPVRLRCEGEYKQLDIPGLKKYQQGVCEVTDENSRIADAAASAQSGLSKGQIADEQTMGMVVVSRIEMPGGLALYAENQNSGLVREIRAGDLLTPGGYLFRLRAGKTTLSVVFYTNGVLTQRMGFMADTVGRTSQPMMLSPGDAFAVMAVEMSIPLQIDKNQPVPQILSVKGYDMPDSSPFTAGFDNTAFATD